MPTILLAQEDAEARHKFIELILDFFPTARMEAAESWEELEQALGAPIPVAAVLTDILWKEKDRADEILILAEKFPATGFALFGRYDLAGSLPPGYPVPLLSPDEELPLRLAEIMENCSGREIGPYVLADPAGPHWGGRLYWAKHHQLARSVQILIPPAGSPVFAQALRRLARVNHPAVYSLYESLPWESRLGVALEPVLNPSLLHLRLQGRTPALLPCARLAVALASVLADMEASGIPARLLGEYDYTLSPQGTPRLRNPAACPGETEVSAQENARHFAEILEPLLGRQRPAESLLRMLRGPFSLASDLLRQTREFERQLAEVREVRVRKEEREAEQKVLQARILRRWAMGLASLGLLGFLALYAKVLFQAFFLDAPGLLPEAELSVPAGTIRREGETVFVDAFHLDRHEVTIGDYEKFLQAIQGDPDWTRWVPENARSQKTSPASLEPRDWAEMLRRARKKEEYQDQVITRDTPVFAVDFASAATYARWKERRLPTMEEWARAAGGDEGLPYPWGTRSENPPANLGVNRGENHRKDPGDSFLNAAPGESFPGDRGPFGHLDMGGNVSEWAVGPLQKAVAMGGNFTDPEAIPLSRARRQDANRQDPSSRSQLEVIGFRTARDDLKP